MNIDENSIDILGNEKPLHKKKEVLSVNNVFTDSESGDNEDTLSVDGSPTKLKDEPAADSDFVLPPLTFKSVAEDSGKTLDDEPMETGDSVPKIEKEVKDEIKDDVLGVADDERPAEAGLESTVEATVPKKRTKKSTAPKESPKDSGPVDQRGEPETADAQKENDPVYIDHSYCLPKDAEPAAKKKREPKKKTKQEQSLRELTALFDSAHETPKPRKTAKTSESDFKFRDELEEDEILNLCLRRGKSRLLHMRILALSGLN